MSLLQPSGMVILFSIAEVKRFCNREVREEFSVGGTEGNHVSLLRQYQNLEKVEKSLEKLSL